MSDIRDWSVTPASNTDLFPEGMAPSAVNDGMRTVQAEIAQLKADENGTLTLGGTSTAYTLTLNTAPASLSDGLYFWATANVESGTGPATLVVTPSGGSAFASKKIKKTGRGGETDIAAGDMIAGGHYLFHYDSAADSGTGAYLLINPSQAEEFVASGTVSAVALQDLTIPSGYARIEIFIYELAITALANFGFRVSTDGTTFPAGASDYRYSVSGSNDAGTAIGLSSAGSSQVVFVGNMNGIGHALLEIPNPGDTANRKPILTKVGYITETGGWGYLHGMGVYNAANGAIQKIRFFPNGGTASFKYIIKGWRS